LFNCIIEVWGLAVAYWAQLRPCLTRSVLRVLYFLR